MAALLRTAIVLAVGGAAAGGPEALRLLLALAGHSPIADVVACVFIIFSVTAPVLGTMLLARYFRVARNAAGAAPPAPATERFALVTLTVALAVVLLVTACLVVLPSIPAGCESDVARYACSA